MELVNWKEKQVKCISFLQKWKYLLIVLMTGILLLMSGGDGAKKAESAANIQEDRFSLSGFEERLKTCLETIDGIGKVELMLALDSNGREIYASDIRKSTAVSYESTISTVTNGSYGEEPIRVTSMSPEFRGAVVVCEGASNDRVRLAVTDAISSLCGLGADAITVIQMKK